MVSYSSLNDELQQTKRVKINAGNAAEDVETFSSKTKVTSSNSRQTSSFKELSFFNWCFKRKQIIHSFILFEFNFWKLKIIANIWKAWIVVCLMFKLSKLNLLHTQARLDSSGSSQDQNLWPIWLQQPYSWSTHKRECRSRSILHGAKSKDPERKWLPQQKVPSYSTEY